MAIQGRSFPNVPIIKRAHLADAFTLGTQPIVIAAPRPGYAAVVVISRAHLVDTFTAPAPITVIAAARGGYPASVYTSRSSLADVVVIPATPAPSTFVYQPRSPLPFPAVVIVGRAHLIDNFTLGTQPTVVAAPRPGYGANVVISRSTLVDVVTIPDALPPSTFVVQPRPPAPYPATVVTARAHLVDTFSLGTAPTVIAASRAGYQATVITYRSPVSTVIVASGAMSSPFTIFVKVAGAKGGVGAASASVAIDSKQPGVKGGLGAAKSSISLNAENAGVKGGIAAAKAAAALTSRAVSSTVIIASGAMKVAIGLISRSTHQEEPSRPWTLLSVTLRSPKRVRPPRIMGRRR